ncbi:MAG: baseplate J/gp47 family protein [Chloroflexi bacterium]|nr:baseplate J/gp47 family protein [Chloroflexota bacterium]
MFGRSKAAPRSQELVFLDPDDDLGTIRSKLESSGAEEVYLVVPRRSPVLRSPLDFRILARVANELSSETILVTGDPTRRRLAEHEGFRTKRSLRTLRHLMLGPDQRPPLLVFPDWAPSLAGLAAMLVGIGLTTLAFALFLPSMKVTLVPQTTQVARDVSITVDPAAQAVDTAAGVLPGELLTMPRDEIAGKLDIPPDRVVGRERARGEIQVISTRPEVAVLNRGTRVMAEGGVKFSLDQELRLNRGVPGRVAVTAVEAGTGSNVPAGAITQFDGFDASGLQVSNPRPTSGGSDRQAKVVNQEDLNKLKDQLLGQARQRALQTLKGRAGDTRTLLDQSLQIKDEPIQFDQQPGAEAEQITGRLFYIASATAMDNNRFNDLVGRVLASSAGSGQKISGAAKIDPPSIAGVQGQKVSLKTKASGIAVPDIDRAGIEQALRGKSPQEIRTILGTISGLAQPPRVELTQAWAPRVYRLDVAVEGPK